MCTLGRLNEMLLIDETLFETLDAIVRLHKFEVYLYICVSMFSLKGFLIKSLLVRFYQS